MFLLDLFAPVSIAFVEWHGARGHVDSEHIPSNVVRFIHELDFTTKTSLFWTPKRSPSPSMTFIR